MPRTRTIAELEKELNAKQRRLRTLKSRRAKLAVGLAAIDRQIKSLGGKAGPSGKPARSGRKRKLPTNKMPLLDYIALVLAKAKKGMRIKNVAVAVKKAGYKTGSKDFYGIVASTIRDKMFKRLDRGLYTVKSETKKAGKNTK